MQYNQQAPPPQQMMAPPVVVMQAPVYFGQDPVSQKRHMGGIHLVDFIITELKNHMIC